MKVINQSCAEDQQGILGRVSILKGTNILSEDNHVATDILVGQDELWNNCINILLYM